MIVSLRGIIRKVHTEMVILAVLRETRLCFRYIQGILLISLVFRHVLDLSKSAFNNHPQHHTHAPCQSASVHLVSFSSTLHRILIFSNYIIVEPLPRFLTAVPVQLRALGEHKPCSSKHAAEMGLAMLQARCSTSRDTKNASTTKSVG